MALDEAKLRERFSAALVAWRTRRGGGDPKRFPQGDAAREVGVSLRTYQHWEGREHMPRRWADVEAVCGTIGIDSAAILSDADDLSETNGQRASSDPVEPKPTPLDAGIDRLLAEQQETRLEVERLREAVLNLTRTLQSGS